MTGMRRKVPALLQCKHVMLGIKAISPESPAVELDALLLSRLQFAWVVAWHILLPAVTVGLASFIAVLEGLHLATGKPVYFRLSGFWIKIFAVCFGMGVVSGIVMPFQLGTNWSRFSDATAMARGLPALR